MSLRIERAIDREIMRDEVRQEKRRNKVVTILNKVVGAINPENPVSIDALINLMFKEIGESYISKTTKMGKSFNQGSASSTSERLDYRVKMRYFPISIVLLNYINNVFSEKEAIFLENCGTPEKLAKMLTSATYVRKCEASSKDGFKGEYDIFAGETIKAITDAILDIAVSEKYLQEIFKTTHLIIAFARYVKTHKHAISADHLAKLKFNLWSSYPFSEGGRSAFMKSFPGDSSYLEELYKTDEGARPCRK